MSAKSVKSIKASDKSLDVKELVAALIVGIILLLLQDSHDGAMLGAMLEALKPEDDHGRALLEDKEDLKALITSLLEEKLDE